MRSAQQVVDEWPGDVAGFANVTVGDIEKIQAECFDHAARLALEQAPLMVDPVGYRSFAAFLIYQAMKVCPGHQTDPKLLDGTFFPSTSNEPVKMDTGIVLAEGTIKAGESVTIAVPGLVPTSPTGDYIRESEESST